MATSPNKSAKEESGHGTRKSDVGEVIQSIRRIDKEIEKLVLNRKSPLSTRVVMRDLWEKRARRREMDESKLEKERAQKDKESLERHRRLSKLFKEDRLSFERERKRMIDELVNSVEDEDQRERLRSLQASWDKMMRGAGSPQNRLVLAQTFFWSHFHEVWHPSIREFSTLLKE